MNANEISLLCIESCERYLEYLRSNSLGIDKIRVTSKSRLANSKFIWELRLGSRLFNSDYIVIQNIRFNEYYSNDDFTIESYEADANKLVFKTKRPIPNLDSASNDELLVISDLKFLI